MTNTSRYLVISHQYIPNSIWYTPDAPTPEQAEEIRDGVIDWFIDTQCGMHFNGDVWM